MDCNDGLLRANECSWKKLCNVCDGVRRYGKLSTTRAGDGSYLYLSSWRKTSMRCRTGAKLASGSQTDRKTIASGYGLSKGGEGANGWVSWAGPGSVSLSRAPKSSTSSAFPLSPSRSLTALCCPQRAGRSQPRAMCRIVLERGRSEKGEPKGPKDARSKQGRKSVDFSNGSCFPPEHFLRLSMSSWRAYTAGRCERA